MRARASSKSSRAAVDFLEPLEPCQPTFTGEFRGSGGARLRLRRLLCLTNPGETLRQERCLRFMGFNKTFAVIVFCFILPVLASAQGVTLGTGVSVGTNTIVPNPLSTVAINDKGGQVYNTKSYGLACNDSTDDTA